MIPLPVPGREVDNALYIYILLGAGGLMWIFISRMLPFTNLSSFRGIQV